MSSPSWLATIRNVLMPDNSAVLPPPRPLRPALITVLATNQQKMARTTAQADKPDGLSPLVASVAHQAHLLQQTVLAAAANLDAHYQQLICDYVDPLFGHARSQQLQELSAGAVTLHLGEDEKLINRQIAYSLLGLGAMVTTGWLYAPALWLFAVPMVYLNSHVYTRAYQVLKAGKVNY